jgi:hypothetical protein
MSTSDDEVNNVLKFPVFTRDEDDEKPTPCNSIITALEELLKRAKTGDVQFLAYACSYDDWSLQHGWVGHADHNHSIFAAIGDLWWEYGDWRNGDRPGVNGLKE